jgi:hypothetical protein
VKTVVRFTNREPYRLREWGIEMRRIRGSLYLRYAVAILATTALMVWISVNEEGRWDDIPGQIAFWAVAITAGWLLMILISRGVRASFGTERWPGWALLLASALIGAVPLTFEVRWLVETILAPAVGLPSPWLTYLNVTVINTVFCLAQYILIERWSLFGSDVETPTPSPVIIGQEAAPLATGSAGNGSPPPTVGMLSRRPDGLSGIIRYLQMEDHYLRVHTDEGDGLTLHRISDARRELEGSDGRQVHRSWWISKAAVSKVKKENRKRVIVASDGTEIPVGRSYERELREAGWI